MDRLRMLIDRSPGNTWDEKVRWFADTNGRSRSSVYKWLTNGPPPNILDAIEYRYLKTLTTDEWPV